MSPAVIKSTATTRCNVGFTEVDGLGAQVRITIYEASVEGAQQLASKQYTVPASTVLQINRIFSDLNLGGEYEAAFAVVDLATPAGP